jgi:antitoxin YefM
MENMTYFDFKNHLASTLDKVNDNHLPILVTRQSGKSAVVMSLEDFKSYAETAYLMSSVKEDTTS